MLADKTVTDLLNAFSSPEPTPGGGSAAALAGALGVSLLEMVAGLPKTKTNTPESKAAMAEARAALGEVRKRLLALIDRDAEAYDLVVAAYKRPKETDTDKAIRKAAIQDAMRIATEMPIETMQACRDALHSGRAVAEHGNPSAKSDLAVGVQLLSTATQGALFNVEINITSLTDPEVVERLTARLREVLKDVGADTREAFRSAGLNDLMKQAAKRAAMVTPEGKHLVH